MKGSFNEKSLLAYSERVAEKIDMDFAEGEVYDFTRCVRANGSFYGTSGRCRQGSPAGPKEEEAPKRSQVDLVTPQKQGQADVDRMKKYLKDESDKLKNLNDSVKKNPEFGKDPEVQKRKKVLERNVAVVAKQLKDLERSKDTTNNPDRQAAIAKISKEKGISAEKAGVEVDKIRMNELNEGVKKYQSMADKARADGFASRAVSYNKQASELIQERADLQAKAKQLKDQTKEEVSKGSSGINLAKVQAAKAKLAADKKANGGKRLDRIQEEQRLEQNRIQRENDKKLEKNIEKEEKAKKPEAPLRGQNLANKMMDHVNISNRVAANHGGAIRTKAAKEEHAAELKKAGVPDRATLTAALKAQRDEAKKPQ